MPKKSFNEISPVMALETTSNYEKVTDKIDERTDRQRPACDEKFRSYPSKMGGI